MALRGGRRAPPGTAGSQVIESDRGGSRPAAPARAPSRPGETRVFPSPRVLREDQDGVRRDRDPAAERQAVGLARLAGHRAALVALEQLAVAAPVAGEPRL